MRQTVVCLTLVMAATIGGCVAEPGDEGQTDGEGPIDLVADCTTPGFVAHDDSVCVHTVRAGEGLHFEPHLAAHPFDPARVLLTSMYVRSGDAIHPSTREIVAAMTSDGGETWPFTTLDGGGPDGGGGDGAPRTFRFAFDAIAAFDGAGNPHVLFGGEGHAYRHPIGVPSALQDLGVGQSEVVYAEMVVARSMDEATTWTFSGFHESPLYLELDDYMDMAIANDTGNLYVVTDSHGERGEPASHAAWPFTIAFWRSEDGGESWHSQALASAPNREEREFQFPRIAAGANGVVVVTAERFDDTGDAYEGVTAWISRDEGATFDGPMDIAQIPTTSENGQQPTVWRGRVDVVYATADQGMAVSRSDDGGKTWKDPVHLVEPTPGLNMLVWESAVDPATGDLYALERTANKDGTGFFLTLLRWKGGEQTERFPLMHAPEVETNGVFEGGHYAGLTVSADGSVWAAWADPREDADPISVARLSRPWN